MADPVSKLIHPSGEAVVTSAKDYISGEPIKLVDGKVGIYKALRPVVSGEDMCVMTDGIHQFPSATAVTFAAAAVVHWHVANKTCVAAVSAGNTFVLGKAFVAKTSGQLVVIVDITAL